MAAIFRAYGQRGTAELIDPFIGVDHAWMSEIGCSFLPHKYADLKLRLPRVAWPVTPFYRRSCAWRTATAGAAAVFEFEEREGTQILPAVGMIRNNGEELGRPQRFAVPDELYLRVEAIEDLEVCGELLKPPIYTGIAIELTPPTLKVRQIVVTA